MNYIRKLAGIEPKEQEESWRVKLAASSANASTQDEPDNFPLRFYVMSFDTLCGKMIDQKLPPGWSEKPPLFLDQNDTERYLKAMCRGGIPPALRSAVWLTSIVRVARPLQSKEETDEFGTLAKVQVLEYGWKCVLDSLFPDHSDKEAVTIPDFGAAPEEVRESIIQDYMTKENGEMCDKGESGLKALTLVLYAAKEYLGIEYCPLLPDLSAIFLSVMPESNAYACIREMSHSNSFYFPLSKIEHLSWCKTFGDLMRKMYPPTALAMARCGALTPEGLDPIFRRFFVTILKREHVLRIMDIYTIEGYKVIFRLGAIILCLAHAYMIPYELGSADAFWRGVKRVAHSDVFLFDILIKQSYGFNGKKYRSRRSFPRRKFIQRIMSYNEKWAENIATDNVMLLTHKPLGFVEGDIPIVLARNAAERLSLAEFLPFSYKATKLELIYSSNVHGRSLEMFYKLCARAKHTITLIEVLNTGAIIGMFATDTWRNTTKVYGDGECVLFRLKPDPVCFPWVHDITKSMRLLNVDADESTSNMRNEVALKQFMISRSNFISMGSNENGQSGLRLDDDLSKGSSARARGFNNEPLAGPDLPEFDVGLVEVYHLLREFDGKAIDGEEDLWKGMFD
mmetsp:Transcript_4011/g.7709  ORF Transcript_4011/g.7709 Transcript_4011/m.7709 type:complete len:624 (+) Transcript_4011:140-2011(+)